MSGELVRYDAMCAAIEAAYEVDEVKDIRDKAMALEAYARQARNTEAERQACEIRLRAERRAGQLSSELETAQGHRSDLTLSHRATKLEALRKAGITRDQASRWEKLAAIPDAEFEAALRDPDVEPTTAGLIRAYEAPRQPVDDKALWLWGRLLDFQRQGLLATDPADICDTMLDHMRDTVRELAPVVAAWLERLTP